MKGLIVFTGHFYDPLDLLHDTLHIGVALAIVTTPGVGAGAPRGQHATRFPIGVDASRVSGSLPVAIHGGDEGADFLVREEVIECDDPGTSGQNGHAVLVAELGLDVLEHRVHGPRAVRWLQRNIQSLSLATYFWIEQVACLAVGGELSR